MAKKKRRAPRFHPQTTGAPAATGTVDGEPEAILYEPPPDAAPSAPPAEAELLYVPDRADAEPDADDPDGVADAEPATGDDGDEEVADELPGPEPDAEPETATDDDLAAAPADGDVADAEPTAEGEPEASTDDDAEAEPPRRRGLFDNAPDRLPKREAVVEEPAAAVAATANAGTEVAAAAVGMIERQIHDLRAELALFIEHANASMARIDRLLTAIRNVDATAATEAEVEPVVEPPPTEPIVTPRGRGFVGGWRPQRD